MKSPSLGSAWGRLELLRPKRGFDLFGVVGWTLTVVLLWLIMFPLLSTFVRVFTEGGTFDFGAMEKVISDPEFHEASLNTGIVLLVAGTAALLIGSVFAWLNERTDASFGVISRILPLVPLLIPPIALAVGWVFLAQVRAGFLNGFLRAVLGLIGLDLTEGPIEIGTWPGMLFVYTIAMVPYAYLVVSAALRNMDTSLEEASRMSGANPWVTVAKVSLPAIRPALASAALLLVIVGVSFFSVPRTIGSLARIDTVSVYIVRLTQTFPSRLDESVAVSLLLLVFVGLVWVAQRRITKSGRHATIGGKAGTASVVQLGKWRWVVRTFMVVYILSVSVLPFAALAVVALQPFWQPSIDLSVLTLDNVRDFLFLPISNTRDALLNSLRLGLIGATVAMTVAAILISYAKERSGYSARIVEGTTKVPGAISNLVIGVAILVALAGPPFNLHGTLFILLLGYLVIYMPQASIAAEVARGQVGEELLEASYMLGGTRFRTGRSILLPLMRPGLAAGWALVFVVVVGDLTASAILSGPRNIVVGSIFLQIWEAGRFAHLATLGTVICLTSTIVVGVVLAFTRGRGRGRGDGVAQEADTVATAAT